MNTSKVSPEILKNVKTTIIRKGTTWLQIRRQTFEFLGVGNGLPQVHDLVCNSFNMRSKFALDSCDKENKCTPIAQKAYLKM